MVILSPFPMLIVLSDNLRIRNDLKQTTVRRDRETNRHKTSAGALQLRLFPRKLVAGSGGWIRSTARPPPESIARLLPGSPRCQGSFSPAPRSPRGAVPPRSTLARTPPALLPEIPLFLRWLKWGKKTECWLQIKKSKV